MREVPLDPGEIRWKRNTLVGRQQPGGTMVAYNATATPLDAYRHARIITARQFEAGDWLRRTWRAAGRQPKLVATLDGVGGASGDGQVGDSADVAQTKAWRRYTARLDRLEPEPASCVWNVCCMEQGAEAWAARNGKAPAIGLGMLKAGLDGLFGAKG